MSLPESTNWTIPDETARIARAAFPKPNAIMRVRDELGTLYDDQDFASLFATCGQPAQSPGRLLLVLVFQYLEGLTDRQAADAVRARIDWKYALGLDLTDQGFDYSILSEFRTRIVVADVSDHLLDQLLTLCKARGLLNARGKQRTDSTHVLAAIRTINRLECVGEAMYHALHTLLQLDASWVRKTFPADWLMRYGSRFDDFRLPNELSKRHALAEQIGRDGLTLLTTLYASTTPLQLGSAPAVDILRRIWVQQYWIDNGTLRWRSEQDLPPNAHLIVSPYDPDARFGVKRDIRWTGYKLHLTETCDTDSPNLITHVATTAATTADVDLTAKIHQDLATRDLTPQEHIVDTGYMDADLIVSSRDTHQMTLIGPVSSDTSWQARAGEGFDTAHFVVDWEARHVTCPQGHHSRYWRPGHDRDGVSIVHVWFDQADCAACPVRKQCTKAETRPRTMKLRSQEQYEALQQARVHQTTPAFKARYARRAGVEGTISQSVHCFDGRQARYRGAAKTHLQHVLSAVAMNLVRLVAWWDERPKAQTRRSRFRAVLKTRIPVVAPCA
jgi:transposase